jgi:hypothetical protein
MFPKFPKFSLYRYAWDALQADTRAALSAAAAANAGVAEARLAVQKAGGYHLLTIVLVLLS